MTRQLVPKQALYQAELRPGGLAVHMGTRVALQDWRRARGLAPLLRRAALSFRRILRRPVARLLGVIVVEADDPA